MVGDHHITQDLEDMVAGVYNPSYLLVGFWQTQLFFFFMFWLASDTCLVNLFRMCSLWVLLWCRSGHGSVRNMTGEALIPSSALSFVIGNPCLPNRTDLSGMCSSQDSFPPLFCHPWICFSSVQDVLIFGQDNYTAYPAALFFFINWLGSQLSGAEAKIHVRPRPDAKESVIEIAGSPKHSHTAPSPGNG
jgi:hypothetical protein